MKSSLEIVKDFGYRAVCTALVQLFPEWQTAKSMDCGYSQLWSERVQGGKKRGMKREVKESKQKR